MLAIENDELLHDGALRAVAMLRMKFEDRDMIRIIDMVNPRNSELLTFWLVAACPGWSGPAVDAFLDRCSRSSRQDVREAVVDAKLRKYRTWKPL
jgi:hypothetical protein